jgi:TRAP-type C4-dicarboxylate transport system substrate-binding protein
MGMTKGKLRAGGYQGAASVHTRALGVLADSLNAADAFSVEVTANVTVLGRNATDLFAMTETGELELCYFASSYLADRVPGLAALDLPFRFTDRTAMAAALDGPFGKALAREVAERTGFAVLAWWDNGFRHFTNRVRPLRHPRDCAGLTIRTMDSALHQASFRALGFIPRYIDVKDYPAAVRSGAVDAQENPLTNTVNFGVPETHKFLTLSGHLCGVTVVLANAAWVAGLIPARHAALTTAIKAATLAQRGFAAVEDDRCLEVIRAAGVEVLGPGDFDRAAFAAAAAEVAAEASARLDPELLARLG